MPRYASGCASRCPSISKKPRSASTRSGRRRACAWPPPIVLHSVLEEYESAFRAAGCSPGVVLPSSLGALGAVNEQRPTMLLKVGQDATSVAVASDGQLLLFRILEGAGSAAVERRTAGRRHLSFAGVLPGQLRHERGTLAGERSPRAWQRFHPRWRSRPASR